MWPFTSARQDVSVRQALQPSSTTTIDLEPQSITVSEASSASSTYSRLAIHPVTRVAYVSGLAGLVGFTKGFETGAKRATLRYRAENAHLTPTSKAGWYLYNKTKNYHGITGGVAGGLRVGVGYLGWTTLFLGLESGLDGARGRLLQKEGHTDVFNTLSAAVAVAGMYSWWHRLDRFAASRMTKGAVRLAVPYGLGQDMLAYLKGERLHYVEVMAGLLEQARSTTGW